MPAVGEAKVGRGGFGGRGPLYFVLYLAIVAGGATFGRRPHRVALIDRTDVAGLAGGKELPMLEMIEIRLDPASDQAPNGG